MDAAAILKLVLGICTVLPKAITDVAGHAAKIEKDSSTKAKVEDGLSAFVALASDILNVL